MKQERKNKFLAVSFAVLSLMVVAILWVNADPPEEVDKSMFRVEKPEQVNRVLMVSDDTVDLTFGAAGWMVNGRYKADLNMIKVLMATLLQHQPRRPLPTMVADSIASRLQRDGTRVRVFSADGLVQEFVAGGNKQKSQAYFLKPGSGNVYLMEIPGYRVYVSGIFELGTNGFRDKYVFSFRWQNFKGLRVTFPARPEGNFEVKLDEQKRFYTIAGQQQADTAKLNAFLTDVSLLTVDRFAEAEELRDTASFKTLMEIAISDIAGREYTLTLFSAEKNNEVPGLTGNDLVYFHRDRIRPILRPKSFFTKQ